MKISRTQIKVYSSLVLYIKRNYIKLGKSVYYMYMFQVKLTFPSIVPFSRIFLVRDLVSRPDRKKKWYSKYPYFKIINFDNEFILFKFEHRH